MAVGFDSASNKLVDTIRIIIKYLKLFQHVSGHKGSIIRELYTALGYNYSNGSVLSVGIDVVGVYCTVPL